MIIFFLLLHRSKIPIINQFFLSLFFNHIQIKVNKKELLSIGIVWLLNECNHNYSGWQYHRNVITITYDTIITVNVKITARLDMTTQLTKLFSFILANVHDPANFGDSGLFFFFFFLSFNLSTISKIFSFLMQKKKKILTRFLVY